MNLRLGYYAVLLALGAHAVAGEEVPVAAEDVAEIGKQLVADLLGRDEYMMYVSDHYNGIHYAEAAMALGAMRFLELEQDAELMARVQARYVDVPGTDHLIEAKHVDAAVWGIVPLQLYLETGDGAERDIGLALADAQWANPDADGLSRQARFWIDDIWMVNSLQTQAWRASADERYLDRAARLTEIYLLRLQQDNGLFFHGPDAPFFWGRGNGWVAAGLAELLAVLPDEHPNYPVIKDGYLKMMEALLAYQSDDGMWRQLIDDPLSWKESSATAMFGFAFITGVQNGLLSGSEYTDAYLRAWQALVERVDEHGQLTDVCVGTGQSLDVNYYLDRPKITGDFHGQAPLLWFAAALMRDEIQ